MLHTLARGEGELGDETWLPKSWVGGCAEVATPALVLVAVDDKDDGDEDDVDEDDDEDVPFIGEEELPVDEDFDEEDFDDDFDEDFEEILDEEEQEDSDEEGEKGVGSGDFED